jgi:HlyD family secretion protein
LDRELPAGIIKARRLKRIVLIAFPIFMLIAGMWSLREITGSSVKRSRIRTAVAEVGPVESTVSATGRVVPAFEQVITSPIASTIEAVYVKTGDSVTAETPLMDLDQDVLRSSRDRIANELELQRTKKQQMTLQLERQRIDLNTSLDIKKLQLQHAQNQFDLNQKLLDIGGITERELQQSDLEVRIARRELDQLTAKSLNQEQSLQADLKALDLQIEIQQSKLGEVTRQLELCCVRSARSAVVTWINDNIGASVTPGQDLVRLADLSRFRVDASISDVHGDKLAVGGTVRMRIGRQYLSGRIETVKPAVEQGVVSFTVDLDRPSHTLLRPNLRVDVQVVTGGVDNATRVANGPFYNGIRDQTVFVIESGEAAAHTVDIGAANLDWVELIGDIEPGDTVIISDMRRYRNAGSVTIED